VVALAESEYFPSALDYEIALGESSFDYDDPNLVLLDTCAQVSIFHNEQLLSNITPVTDNISISGLSRNASTIRPALKGTLPGFDNVIVYVSPETKRNILCYVDISNNYEVKIIDKKFHVNSSLGNISFEPSHNVIAQLFEPLAEVSSISAQPLTSRVWTKTELANAELVIQFMSRSAFESYSSTYQVAKNGTISGLPFTTRDVANAEQIYGPLVPILKGKSVAHHINLRSAVAIDKMEIKQQTLDLDIFYCGQFPFLLSLSNPLKLCVVDLLSKGEKSFCPST
jgi:hypothetical protein